MKSSEFIIEGEDTSIADIQQNHPDVFAFLSGIIPRPALLKATSVEAYNTANSHMIRVAFPSVGIETTEDALQQAGMGYQALKSPYASGNGGKILSGSVGEMHWNVSEETKLDQTSEIWLFALPHADGETAYYHDRTME